MCICVYIYTHTLVYVSLQSLPYKFEESNSHLKLKGNTTWATFDKELIASLTVAHVESPQHEI